MTIRPSLWLALVVSLPGCGIVLGYDELAYEGASGQAGGSGSGLSGASGQGAASGTSAQAGVAGTSGAGGAVGGAGAGGGAPEVECPATGRGPVMARIPRPDGGWTCIDRTEVTRQQYAQFVAATDKPTAPGKECSWNLDNYEDKSCENDPFVCKSCQDRPKTCVDLCDARAFCLWAGKRLCGSLDGGPTDPDDFADASRSQWMNACSSGGKYQLPYGDDYDKDACATYSGASSFCESASECSASSVEAHPKCQSPDAPYAGVFDLSGNAYEIEDSCAAQKGANDACRVRGGGFVAGPGFQYCDTDDNLSITRSGTYPYIGFRCCAP